MQAAAQLARMGGYAAVVPTYCPKKPPRVPSVLTTRWHGTKGQNGFVLRAPPIAWDEPFDDRPVVDLVAQDLAATSCARMA